MRDPAPYTAEDAEPRELWRASVRLGAMLAALGLIVVPLIDQIPLGQTSQTWILAALLVVLALYWLFAGMGYRPLLLLQLVLFSAAVMLLSAKVLLVVVDVHRLSILRRTARTLIMIGAWCAMANLGGMLLMLLYRIFKRRKGPRDAVTP